MVVMNEVVFGVLVLGLEVGGEVMFNVVVGEKY